jgi:hypothetical protein
VFLEDSQLERIEEGALSHTALTHIQIPNSVKLLGKERFAFYTELHAVVFGPMSILREMRASAFQGTNLEKFSVPLTCQLIGDLCFADYRKFTTLNFDVNSQLREIGTSPFFRTKLMSLVLPLPLQFIDGTVDRGVTLYCYPDPLLTSLKLLDDELFSFDLHVFIRHFGNRPQFVVPKYVQVLGKACFAYCDKLEKVTFAPNSDIHSIEESAFAYIRLRSIVLPKTLAVIDDSHFFGMLSTRRRHV